MNVDVDADDGSKSFILDSPVVDPSLSPKEKMNKNL